MLTNIFTTIKNFFKKKNNKNNFEKFSLPQIRRVMPTLVSSDLIEIKPMTAPNCNLFYMNFGNENELTRTILLEKTIKPYYPESYGPPYTFTFGESDSTHFTAEGYNRIINTDFYTTINLESTITL